METEYTLGASLLQSPAQIASLVILLTAAVVSIAVYGPLFARVRELVRFRRSLAAFGTAPADPSSPDLKLAFERSPVAPQWRRYTRERANGAAPDFVDVLARQPLLASGVRRSLLPTLPFLLIGIGLLAASFVWSDSRSSDAAPGTWLPSLGILGLALAAGTVSAWLHGRLGSVSHSLATWVDGHVTASEARGSGPRLDELVHAIRDTLDVGLARIERSTAEAAQLVSEEQRRAVQRIVEDIVTTIQEGVAERLRSLHAVVSRTIEQQQSLASVLSHHLERLVEGSESQSRVSFSLEQAAVAVEESSRALEQAGTQFRPIVTSLRDTQSGLHETAVQTRLTQEASERSVTHLKDSYKNAATLSREQHAFIETSVGEIRTTLELLNQGLGDNLSHALESVDDVVAKTVSRLSETLLENSQTIDRLGPPMRAAEGISRELQTSLEQLRADVSGVSEWFVEAVRPARHTLSRLDDRTSAVVRALSDLSERTRSLEAVMQRASQGSDLPHAAAASPATSPTADSEPVPAPLPEPQAPASPEPAGSLSDAVSKPVDDAHDDMRHDGLSGLLSRHQFATPPEPAPDSEPAPPDEPGEESDEEDGGPSDQGKGGGLRGLLRRS